MALCKKSVAGPSCIIEYKKIDGGNDLHVHMYSPPEHKDDARTPAIIFFFGGGWQTGSVKQFSPQSEHLASRGMVAICAEYRTEQSHGTPPSACVKDAKSAMRWVRRHAAALGIAPRRIAAGGGSAGGHLALALATLDDFNEEGEDTSVDCRPDALVLFNPVLDNGPDSYGYERVKDYWQNFSPFHNLHEGIPPTTVFLGTEDNLIPVETAETFKDNMEALGNRCDLHLYQGQKHGFFNSARYAETLLEADKFLVSLGFLKAKPTAHQVNKNVVGNESS